MKGTIVMSKNTQVETGVAVLEHGFALLEPRAWATKKKEGEEAAKADAPKFSAGVDFDKKLSTSWTIRSALQAAASSRTG